MRWERIERRPDRAEPARAPEAVPADHPTSQLLLMQRTAGNQAVARALTQAGQATIARDWNRTNNASIAAALEKKAANASVWEQLTEMVARVQSIPPKGPATIAKLPGGSTNIRIDMQRTFQRDGETWATVQGQVGKKTVCGLVFPVTLELEEIQAGLLESIAEKDLLSYVAPGAPPEAWEGQHAYEAELANWAEGEMEEDEDRWAEGEDAYDADVFSKPGKKAPY